MVLMALGSALVWLDSVKIALLPVTLSLGVWAAWHHWGSHSGITVLNLILMIAGLIWCAVRRRRGR